MEEINVGFSEADSDKDGFLDFEGENRSQSTEGIVVISPPHFANKKQNGTNKLFSELVSLNSVEFF